MTLLQLFLSAPLALNAFLRVHALAGTRVTGGEYCGDRRSSAERGRIDFTVGTRRWQGHRGFPKGALFRWPSEWSSKSASHRRVANPNNGLLSDGARGRRGRGR